MPGPPCGNNPDHRLTPGDRAAVAEARAYLHARRAQEIAPPSAAAETDEERADREETAREHAAGIHTHCGVTCEVDMPTELLRNFILAKSYPGAAGALDELLRRAREERPLADPAAADTPTPLRWGLDDVEYADDGATIILLAGPDGEPYCLELDPERTAALGAALADFDQAEDVEDEEPGDSDSDVFALISEIASRLRDATDDGEYHAVGLIYDLANGCTTVADAHTELAEIQLRHV